MIRRMTTRQGDRLDRIAIEVYGRPDGTTEAILAANPGLAGQPPHLPAGVEIVLPDVPVTAAKPTVRLWD